MARPPKELTPEKSVEDLLGSKIRKLRLARGWEITELAARCSSTRPDQLDRDRERPAGAGPHAEA